MAAAKKKATGELVTPKHGAGKIRAGGGRPVGAKNKITNDIREMIMEATRLAAVEQTKRKDATAVDYLKKQALEKPEAFIGLLRKMIPAKVDIELALTGEDLSEILHARRDALAAQRAKVIEGETS